jgi:hypothetical protein
MKKWVRLTKAVEVCKGYVVPEGTVGFIKEGPCRIAAEEGDLLTEYGVHGVSRGSYEPLELPTAEEALETLRRFAGHHCQRPGWFQFNIKVREDLTPPEWVREALTDEERWQKESDIASQELANMVDAGECDSAIQADFPWVKDWHQAGRMGGWLVLQHGSARRADAYEWDGETDEAIDLALDLELIERRVERGVKAYAEYVRSDDAWEGVAEDTRDALRSKAEWLRARADRIEEVIEARG